MKTYCFIIIIIILVLKKNVNTLVLEPASSLGSLHFLTTLKLVIDEENKEIIRNYKIEVKWMMLE